MVEHISLALIRDGMHRGPALHAHGVLAVERAVLGDNHLDRNLHLGHDRFRSRRGDRRIFDRRGIDRYRLSLLLQRIELVLCVFKLLLFS